MEQAYYNIYDIVKIKIETVYPHLIEEYEYHLRNFKTAVEIQNPNFKIMDLDVFLLPKKCFNISNNLYGFKNGFFNKKEEYAVEFQNDVMKLYIKDNTLCLTTLIEHLLLPLGYTFVHGAGISFKNQGIIFPAPPNTGKTLLMSALTKMENVKFFGDDYLILKNNGIMLAYPMDFSIYKYHFKFFEELEGSLEQKKIKKNFFERIMVNLVKDLPIKIKLKKIARFFKYDYLKGGEFLKIPACRLVPKEKFGESASLKYVVFLNQYNGSEFKIEKVTPENASREILGTLFSEWEKTMPFFYALSSFGLLDFSSHINRMKKVVDDAFFGLEVFRILLPKNIDIDARLEGMKNILEKEVFGRI